MIRISCTSCNKVLTIDDAFAGGVCRCQFCGTIQTVPAHLKGSGNSGAVQPAQQQDASRALFRNKKGRGVTKDRGAAAALSKSPAPPAQQSPPGWAASQKNLVVMLGVAGGTIIVLLLVVIMLLW